LSYCSVLAYALDIHEDIINKRLANARYKDMLVTGAFSASPSTLLHIRSLSNKTFHDQFNNLGAEILAEETSLEAPCAVSYHDAFRNTQLF